MPLTYGTKVVTKHGGVSDHLVNTNKTSNDCKRKGIAVTRPKLALETSVIFHLSCIFLYLYISERFLNIKYYSVTGKSTGVRKIQ